MVVGSQPENDLAVLQPRNTPDELQPAILASTAGLMPGDGVVATGFPFGIGPSVTSGVVSGLKREFDDPNNHHRLTNLIQFDAAVNPGNSGGPLVNRDGEVVGIVTAILTPPAPGYSLGSALRFRSRMQRRRWARTRYDLPGTTRGHGMNDEIRAGAPASLANGASAL